MVQINNPIINETEIIGQVTTHGLSSLDLSGYKAILTGAKSTPMILLGQLLLKLNITLTLVPEGEPSIRFEREGDNG